MFWQFLLEANFRDLVDDADKSLEGPAAQAVDDFVGLSYKAVKQGAGWGIMFSKELEDAYSPSPSSKGMAIRDGIDRAMNPVRDEIRKRFGNTITLYRAQHAVTDGKPRNLLSWSISRRVANSFAGLHGKPPQLITDKEIRAAIRKFEQTGEVIWRQKRFVLDPDPEIQKQYPGYFDIFDRHGEHITSDDGLEKYFKDDQEWMKKKYDEYMENAKNVLTARVDVDAIVWITDRMNQMEFIIHNRPRSRWYIDKNGKLR